MTSHQTTTNSARSLRTQNLACVALLVWSFGPLLAGNVQAEENAADPYDVLYDVILTRYGKDGKSYGESESSPALFDLSNFPFGDKTYKKFNLALDAFAALPQEKMETYSDIKRALLQRHLWKVFDATLPGRQQQLAARFPNRSHFRAVRSHSDRRAATRPKIASLIQRLALTRAQILALPNTFAATVESGDFEERHDPGDLFKPFLPADLYSKEGSWICLGDSQPGGMHPQESSELGDPIPADIHSTKFKWRSAFLPFMRVPGGRLETLKCVEKFNRMDELPVGTQFALIEQAFLISDEGELVLSPLIVSISLRAYVGVNPSERTGRPQATQSVAEFLMQPRRLMQGDAVMRALAPQDYRYEAGTTQDLTGGTFDVFESREGTGPRLKTCVNCHGHPTTKTRIGFRTARPKFLKEDSPEAISKATAARKRDDKTWKALHELWQADSKKRDAQSSTPSNQPQQRLDNNEPATRGVEDAAKAVTRSEFDKLYDVLMVRHARNGESYGDNEIAPMIFKFSGFPFDDATYPRLTAALDALTPEDIKSYSVVQHAILQRQLWAVFDATIPSRFVLRRPHETRRAAVHKQLAGLIRQLALKRSEIESLPDTLLTTVQEKKYPTEFDLDEPTSPFLPPDLVKDSSTWICFGRSSTPVNLHATDGRWRSAFFQFIRLPGGRDTTIEYLNHWNKEKPFPARTQFALIEKAFLVSDEGKLVLSPMTVSLQLRAYRNVEQSVGEADTATQCVAEFISRPRDYLRGNALMAAVSPTDYRIKTVSSDGGKQDVIELVNDPKISLPSRLGQCMQCHGGAAIRSLGDFVAPRGTLKSLQRRSHSEIVQATAKSKRDDKSWKLLQSEWDSANR